MCLALLINLNCDRLSILDVVLRFHCPVNDDCGEVSLAPYQDSYHNQRLIASTDLMNLMPNITKVERIHGRNISRFPLFEGRPLMS